MNELHKLKKGLRNSTTMLLKEAGNALECSFLSRGLVNNIVLVKDEVLAAELRHAACLGILEGAKHNIFKNTFDSFALHVKARKLYLQLRFSMNAAEATRDKVLAA